MDALLAQYGLEAWKPVIAALMLPPVPFLLMVLVGARMVPWRRGLGWFTVLMALAAIWLSGCAAVGDWLMRDVLKPPLPLDARARAALRLEVVRTGTVSIVALGGGMEANAPEYGAPSLSPASLVRLRYAIWLGRELGAPVGFSGGVGHAQDDGPAEASIAARIAVREYNRPLRWAEGESRDTRENAAYTVAALKAEGVRRIVLVTHAWHMPRALRAFEEAAGAAGADLKIVAAPIAWAPGVDSEMLRWLPSAEGHALVRQTLREMIGLLAGS
jgi:uncharacterized SAM-binding protein YcdF (DUF218 family)